MDVTQLTQLPFSSVQNGGMELIFPSKWGFWTPLS